MIEPKNDLEESNPSEIIDKISAFLQQKTTMFSSIKPLTKATIPVIKLEAIPELHSIKLDITIKTKNHKGLDAVEVVKAYLKQYPHLHTLVLLFKYILKMTELNDPYKGGLGSYGILLMLVAFFQRKPDWPKNINIGKLFICIMHFYTKWNPFYTCICPMTPNFKTSGLEQNIFVNMEQFSEVPIIRDPLYSDSLNNVTRNASQIAKILDVFFTAVNSIWMDCLCTCHKRKSGTKNFCDGKHKVLNRIFAAIQGCSKMHEILF